MNNLVLKKGVDYDAFADWLTEKGIIFTRVEGLPRHFRVEGFPEHPHIHFVEEDAVVKGDAAQPLTLNPDMTGAWQLLRTIRRRAPYPTRPFSEPQNSFFDANLTGAGVDIHVIDTGVSNDVTELATPGRLIYQFFAIPDTGTNGDDQGHGTACAVLAAGSVHGIARGANVLSYKALNSGNTGSISDIVSAMGNALTQYNGRSNPGVVSMSIGGTGNNASVNSAMDDMIDAGMVVLVSAGNGFTDIGTFDSTYTEADPDAIVVGGTMYDDWSYFDGRFGTNWGTRVDILSPSKLTETILATDAGGGPSVTRLFSGTSAGCPIAAGVMACYLQGLSKLTGRSQVQAAKQYLLDVATTGAVKIHPIQPVLPDRIVYLNPNQSVNNIPGINA